ncbi:MAG TPA: alpha/beta hydrolase [Acidimicrobiales bacterium]|nr:alpha/beta hydrolase [Acidimicrobiales bacterium]
MEATVRGNGTPAVVLLHGQPGTGGDWHWVAPLLEDRYTLVIPDRPGYGRTGGQATGFAGNARATVDLLDRLQLERAVLVAHSWAGGVALAAAISHPERVAGLVLASSVGPGERFGWDDRVLAAPLVGEAIAAATIGGLGLVLGRRRVQSAAARRLDGRAHEAVQALTRLTRGGSRVWRSFVTEQRAMLDELEGLGEGLAAIHAPTVVLHGRSDRLVPPAVAESLAAAIPDAELRVVPDAGHLLPHDRPQDVAAAVDRVAGSTG